MRYIKPEIEINEIGTVDIMVFSKFSNIVNQDSLSSEQMGKVDLSTSTSDDGTTTGNITVGADFFN